MIAFVRGEIDIPASDFTRFIDQRIERLTETLVTNLQPDYSGYVKAFSKRAELVELRASFQDLIETISKQDGDE